MSDSDENLLKSYALDGNEAAFRTLAQRYLGLIFHTAFRRVGNRPLAEEVSQNILCALAKKAASLAKNPDLLSAWLHRATLYESSKAMRSEISHQRRKRLEHPDTIQTTATPESSPWAEAVPHIDGALDKLGESDRAVILLHYFENRPLPEVARQLGKNTAAVQKQSQRALGKLAGILRGKGISLSVALLATGLSTEMAKAAPVHLLKTATAAALKGTATYSTLGLDLMFAMKSKALIPCILIICALPLAVQQIAISSAENHRDQLLSSSAAGGDPPPRNRPSLTTASTDGVSSDRISISALSRAQDEADESELKYLDFQILIASLTPEDLIRLIPEAVNLPEGWRKKSSLLEFLMKALAKTDPETAVKVALAADPRGGFVILNHAFSAWTLKDPDAAYAHFLMLYEDRNFNPLIEGDYPWSHNFVSLLDEFVKSLVAAGSPHARDVILMAPESVRESTFFNSIGVADVNREASDREGIPKISPQNFAGYLPLIREFLPAEQHQQAFDRLVYDADPFSDDFDLIIAGFVNRTELLPAERNMIAASYANRAIGRYYNTSPHPDLAEIESRTLQWLEKNVPEDAQVIFGKAKADTYETEMGQVRRRLESLSTMQAPSDSELIQGLGWKVYGEMLPQALEQAERIKDPVKRDEVIQRLKNP